MGVGQKSSAAELTGSPRFSGAPKGASVLARWATQMSSGPIPPGRFDAMYRLSPSGDWIGQPSRDGVFSSELLAAISSTFWAGAQAEKCAAWASAADTRLTIASREPSVVHLSHLFRSLSRRALLHSTNNTVTVGRVTGRVTGGGSTWV